MTEAQRILSRACALMRNAGMKRGDAFAFARATLSAKTGHPTPDTTPRPAPTADTEGHLAALRSALGYVTTPHDE